MKAQTTFSQFASILFLFLIGSGCTTPSTKTSTSLEKESANEIEMRLTEIFDACIQKDFERLESYHAYGPKFSRFSASSPSRMNSATTSQIEREGLGAIHDLEMNVHDLKVDVFHTTAIATFVLNYNFRVEKETIHKKERSTIVFVKENNEWLIAHEHLSPITETASEH